MKKIFGICVLTFFELVGCAHKPKANISTIHTSGVDATATRNNDGETTNSVNTEEAEEECQRKWATTLPASVPTDPAQAEQYAQRVNWIIGWCERRGDMGAAQGAAHNAQAQSLGQEIGGVTVGGAVIGTGPNFPGYAASMPYIVPNGSATMYGGQGTDPKVIDGLKQDFADLAGSQVDHELRIGALETPSTGKKK